MPDVNPRRRYDNRRRRAQADATRRAMLESARKLLLERGYAATSLAAVAEDAGVSSHTVYKAFRNKPGLLKAVFDFSVAGDDEPEPIIQRDRADRIRAEPDPVRKIEMYADGLIGTLTRAAPVQLLARAAAEGEPEMQPIWEQMQRERLIGMSHLAQTLADGGHLAPDISTDVARDILWAYTSPELYQLLVLQRGWPPSRYRDWIARSITTSLLADPR